MQRAKALLAVAEGKSFTQAAHEGGYSVGDSVAALVKRFNAEGVAALQPRHAGGTPAHYGLQETQRILQEVQHLPSCEQEGAAVWSLSLLKRSLREAEDGLPKVNTFTIWKVLHEAGYSWQLDRSWFDTGVVKRTASLEPSPLRTLKAAQKKTDRAGVSAWGTARLGSLLRR